MVDIRNGAVALLLFAGGWETTAVTPQDQVGELVDAAALAAEWGVQHGFVLEGAALARRCLRAVPGHRVAGVLRAAVDADLASDAAGQRGLRRRHEADWTRRMDALRARLVGVLAGAEHERELALAIAALAPELPVVGTPLARHGYALLGRHGPVPTEELQGALRELRAIGGTLIGAAGGERLRAWPDAYAVRTPHYRLTTDVPLALAVDIVRDLERIHVAWVQLAAETGLEVAAGGGELTVLAFAMRSTFDLLGADGRLKRACAREAATVGVYSMQSGEAAAFLPADDAAGRRQVRENLCHEAVHQLFHLRVRGRRDLDPASVPFSWVEEATCLHCETSVGTGRLGGECDDDLREGVFRAQVDDDPWLRVSRVSRGLLLDAGDFGCVALLGDLFLRSPDADVRGAFLAALRADLAGAEPDRGAVLSALGSEAAARRAFAAHTESVAAKCGR